jgi:hypothetical protein
MPVLNHHAYGPEYITYVNRFIRKMYSLAVSSETMTAKIPYSYKQQGTSGSMPAKVAG